MLSSRLTFPRNQKTATSSEMPTWIQEALAVSFSLKCEHHSQLKHIQANEVYTPTETKIPSVKPIDANFGYNSQETSGPSHGCHRHPRFSPSAQQEVASGTSTHRYRKADLLNAHVINQVDRKFIACLISDSGESDIDGVVAEGHGIRSLVLIDQHAADERVRVERLLRPLCIGFLESMSGGEDKNRTVETRELSPAVPILLTSYELSILAGDLRIRRTFRNWGFGFGELGTANELSDGVTGSGYVQVIVRSIPEVVADKASLSNSIRFMKLSHGHSFCLETNSVTW